MIPPNRPFAWGFFFALGAYTAVCLLTLFTWLILVAAGRLPNPWHHP